MTVQELGQLDVEQLAVGHCPRDLLDDFQSIQRDHQAARREQLAGLDARGGPVVTRFEAELLPREGEQRLEEPLRFPVPVEAPKEQPFALARLAQPPANQGGLAETANGGDFNQADAGVGGPAVQPRQGGGGSVAGDGTSKVASDSRTA